jgi:putative ABC transport system permease protein
MAWWSRLARTLRSDRVGSEIDEELASHLEEAIAHGRDPNEARRAIGGAAQHREVSRDIRIVPWLDVRQILKSRVTSTAAILSLGLAMGASVAAFRVVDAVLLRPLPIAHPERLLELVRTGRDAHGAPLEDDSCEYPLFVRMRDRIRDRADVIAISPADPVDVFYERSQDAEKAYRQFVSGTMFEIFGLRPAMGRLLTADDDAAPGASPYAVVSYGYWTRRFGRDRSAIGLTLRVGSSSLQIVGVAPAGFTGVEPGVSVDFFVPAMMNPQASRADNSWLRAFVHLHPGGRVADAIGPLRAVFQSFQEERAGGFVGLPPEYTRAFLSQTLVASSASSGVSSLQKNYARALTILAVFVALVLLIACANISSLKIAQAAARSREMALRVSIGAGRGRLVQLMLVESAIIALAAGTIGAGVAWWAAPFVVSRFNPPARAIALELPVDWRIAAFSLLLTGVVAMVFGLVPALRASGVSPLEAIKDGAPGGSRRAALHAPVAGQVAFCALVLLLGGLFVSTLDRLAQQPVGFSAAGLIDLDTIARPAQPQSAWMALTSDVGATPGVEAVAASGWPLLSGLGSNAFVWRNGAPTTNTLAYFLTVSPGWIGVMRIPLLDGRDLRDADLTAGAALVNQAFAKEFLPGVHPVGQSFERQLGMGTRPSYEIVGVVGDARYRNIREPITPTAYVPLAAVGSSAGAPRPLAEETIVVRTSAKDPAAVVSELRRVVGARSAFRVSSVQTQQAIDEAQTVRERLLATLAWFFSLVALALTTIGIYGVMHYTVQQRQREIAICRAIGAPSRDILWSVTRRIAVVLAIGTITGLGAGMVVVRYVTTLLYEVRATDARQLATPAMAVIVAGVLAALPPVVRALRVSPTVTLRGD